MKCVDCKDMTCKVFTAKTELWNGYCMNKDSPKYHTAVKSGDGCTIIQELSLF